MLIISVYLQVFFNSGLTNNKDDFELCLRAENVELPKSGYFGVSAATGGLAGNFNGHNLSHLSQSYPFRTFSSNFGKRPLAKIGKK